MTNREKVKNALRRCESYGDCEDEGCPYYYTVGCLELLREDALTLLEEQEQIKSPDEFKRILLCMFNIIWDVEIDHPNFQDTVGELMEDVLQVYREAVKWK